MELYLDQNLALLTQKGFKKPRNCVLSWLTSQGHRYSILIATPRNLGYIFAHNGLTEIGREMRYLIYLKRQKMIWSCSIKCFLFYELSFILTTVKLTCKAFIQELHIWFTLLNDFGHANAWHKPSALHDCTLNTN